QIVAGALVAIVLGRRVAGRPVDHVELRIVCAGEPSRRAAVLEILTLPGFGARFTALGNGPDAPDLFASGLVVGRHQPARPVLSAGDTGITNAPAVRGAEVAK